MQKTVQDHSEEMLAKKELERLRLQLWRARSRNSRRLGGVMLILSATLLVIAYFTRYIIFEVTALLTLAIGTFLLVINMEPQVRLRPANQAFIPLIQIFINLKQVFKATGKGIFIPCKTGEVKLLLLKGERVDKSLMFKIVEEGKFPLSDGLLLPSLGQGLYELYEEELNEIRGKDLAYIFEWLPRVIVDGLNLCEKVQMIMVDDNVHTVLTKPFVRDICQRKDMKEHLCNSTGCPLTASIAETLAASTGQPVHHIECRYEPLRQEAYAIHKLDS